MLRTHWRRLAVIALGVLTVALPGAPSAAWSNVALESDDLARLVAALLGPTPLLGDLAALSDQIGGRPTGSPANLRAVDWAAARFRDAGVDARRDPFTMPGLWLERSATARVSGTGVDFAPRVAAMPFSSGTPPDGATAPLLDAGFGTEEDFKRLGASARGGFLLVDTHELTDVEGLFREYAEATAIEARAGGAGAAGVVYVGSRPNSLLYRHNASLGLKNTKPMIVMERDAGKRALRLLRGGDGAVADRKARHRVGPLL